MKQIGEAAKESTCQKRITVCVIYDKEGSILACESNRCSPDNGICERLGIVQNKEGYGEKNCNWTHAEVMATKALPKNSKPYRAIVYGHDFICIPCEKVLHEYGIEKIEIIPSGYGTGLR